MKPIRVIGLTLAVGMLSEIAYYIWRNQLLTKLGRRIFSNMPLIQTDVNESSKDSAESELKDPYFYKVLIFPDRTRACRSHFWGEGCRYEKCFYSHEEDNSMYQFISHIMSAQRTLDVCVYVMTDHELANYVISVKQKGILVRVITNQDAQNYTGTQVGKFRNNGIQVRTNTNYLMHHKFVVVDKTVAISGSFNWTSHATTANNENMIISNNPHIVQPYVQEFDKLWEQFGRATER